MRLLLPSADKIGKEEHKTGVWFEEFAVPYLDFLKEGYFVTTASLKGGKASIDKKSENLIEDLKWKAIIKNPSILLCDEPTGALDYHTSKEILKLIEDVNQKYGNTVIMVTHNDAIKNMADRVIRLRDGQIRKNYVNETKIAAGDLDW